MNTPVENPFRVSRLNNAQDYRPEWDVPSLNEKAVNFLTQEIRSTKGLTRPNPEQRVSVILAAPGYGKTHLFGRITHELGGDVFFVYIPGMDDVKRPLEHVCRYTVDALFHSAAGQPSRIARALARLCHASFKTYLDQFPPSLAPKFQPLALELEAEPDRILDMVGAVKELAPFLKLASSIADRVVPPGVPEPPPHSVMKALALGWSPAAALARRWLKGESLQDQELDRLGLENEPPQPIQILQGVAAIFQYRTPVVICCDQMELALIAARETVPELTARFQSILEKVPNHTLVLSCLEAEWRKDDVTGFEDNAFQSFRQRLYPPLKLSRLKEEQAVELVARRLGSAQLAAGRGGALWPFDDATLLTYVRDEQPTPRFLIQRCDKLFQDWLEGGRQGVIYFSGKSDGGTPAQQFLRLWNAELEHVQEDASFSVEDYPVERLQRGIREALRLARESFRDLGGIRVKNIREDVVEQVKTGKAAEKRYSFAVEVEVGSASGEIVVPVTDLNNGARFTHLFNAVTKQFTSKRLGGLLVHRAAEFEMGPKTRQAYDREVEDGRIKLFAMEDNLPTLVRLESLLRFLDRAGGRELVIGNETILAPRCQALILETAVLDNLDLFRALGAWKKLHPPSHPAAAPSAPPAPSAPVRSPAAQRTPPASAAGTPTPQPAPAVVKLAATAVATPPAPVPAPPLDVAARYVGWAQGKLDELVKKLGIWGQPVRAEGVEVGPRFARLKVTPNGSKTSINRIRDKGEDVKIHLGLSAMPLIDSQAGCVSVDVQLPESRVVKLDEALAASPSPKGFAFPAGTDVSGQVHWLDLADTSDCHLLVAGQTGSGKSEFLRAMAAALATRFEPDQLQFILIDPKRVTFNLGGLTSPYLHAPVALDTDAAVPLLRWCQEETGRRYDLLAQRKQTSVADLDASLVPRVVVIIDEFANLLEDKQAKAILTPLLKQIGSMSRAAGIHLVLATQRPDKDVVTPLLRDNLPGRVALQVKTEASSKLIIGTTSAAYLLGKGDLLWQHGGGLVRLQSPFVGQGDLETALRAH
jgi:S-DNA-T family DNA segregation ATPase FtsK/SpoIIIE